MAAPATTPRAASARGATRGRAAAPLLKLDGAAEPLEEEEDPEALEVPVAAGDVLETVTPNPLVELRPVAETVRVDEPLCRGVELPETNM